jgi:type IV pilus assembly protein PilM
MSLSSFVHSILPVPNYLRLPSVGVDVSDSSLKYIQFKPNYAAEELELVQWGEVDIPADTVSRGEVLDVEKLTATLRELKRLTKTAYVRMSLPEERAYLFETEIKPGTPYKEIRGALEFRLEENVPLSPRDAYFDYEIITPHKAHAPLRVSVTVYARETINQYYEATRAAGLVPLSFEVEAAAIGRASLPPGDVGTHMIVDFGKTRTGVGIMHHGTLMYTSTIDIGGVELSRALEAVLGATDAAELTTIKNTIGLTESTTYPKVAPILQKEMSIITDELMLRLQYWNSHAGGQQDHEVQSVVLCGGSSNLKGLPAFIESRLAVPARRVDVWQNAFSLDHTIPPIDLRHSYGYATAIGLALAGHIAFYD